MTGTASPVLLDLSPLTAASGFQGIGRYIRELSAALVSIGAASGENPLVQGFLFDGHGREEIVPLEEAGAVSPLVAAPPSRAALWRRRFFLGGAVLEAGAHCLHAAEPAGTPLIHKPLLVVTCHDLIPLKATEIYARRPVPLVRLRRLLHEFPRYHMADRIIAVSSAVKNDLVSLLHVSASRIEVISHGVDPRRFNPFETRGDGEVLDLYHLTPGFLLFLGTADPRKNLEFLLHVLATLPADFRLVVAGKLHPARARALRAKATSLNIEDRVYWLGYVPEHHVPVLYRHACCFVFPTLDEGFGLPVLEAMACGTPVLASDIPVLREVAGDAAMLAQPSNQSQWREAILRLARGGNYAESLRLKGARHAARFRWEETARRTAAVYESVLRQK